jgi:membrane protease subunit (stomatin/prohibitin family)
MRDMRQYKAANGATQWQPSIQDAMVGNGNGEGFCLACGYTQPDVKSDAQRRLCDACGMAKVCGFEKLVAWGLAYAA